MPARLASAVIALLSFIGAFPAHAFTLESLVWDLAKGNFTDVDARAWYAPYVATMVKRNIVSGDTDARGAPRGTFRPGDFVTIAEALKIALRAAGVDETECTASPRNFSAASHWARNFVACGEGLRVRILQPGTLLDRAITRAETLALLDDVFADDVAPAPMPFHDALRHPYAADIAHNARLAIISGDTNAQGRALGTFRPDDPLRRSEIVKIVARKLELVEQ